MLLPMSHFRNSLTAARETLDALGAMEQPLNRAAAAVLAALT